MLCHTMVPDYQSLRLTAAKHAFHQYEKARLVAKLKVARERDLKTGDEVS
jgi:hypothetical protein